ncbi:uncharacterized protein LOC125837722 [Solanum verrucosum]|uniref:uncharacterized protein LOC125837722 n=1 Tax=Solanum verrucosum TaxID=315347 RepID=UPI0020D09BE0|nr:uncharacterized protein LOC125837722 [Solanum verrucosum]
MDEEDAEKTAFTTPWGTYCYRVMPFGLKNAGATYMRAMTTMFHDMMQKKLKYMSMTMDPLKYIFQKPLPTGRLAKWQIFLTEFDIIYATRTTIKDQALADHLAENPVDGDYKTLDTYFLDEEINLVEEVDSDENQA